MIIHNNCALGTMKMFGEGYIDMTISSPPYDNIRDYKGFKFPFEKIAKELYRVTKEGGVVVWVVNDQVIKGSESGTSFRQALYFMEVGFRLHDTMIFEKNGSAFPASRTGNRYTQIFEYMFVFSKGKPKTHNLICDKPNKHQGFVAHKTTYRNKAGELIQRTQKPVPSHSPRNNIWRYIVGFGGITKDKIAHKHPAIFPDKLAEDHILTWSNPGDLIYDCCGGSGTTGIMAHQHKRKFILSEFSDEYCKVIQKRFQERFNVKVPIL
jgi:site-specific DNA-methyltransferase (adenine-specific)